MSGSSIPNQYDPVPTRALWNWNTTVSGQAPTVTSYANGSPTKSGALRDDLEDFLGIPIQKFSTPAVPFSDAVVLGWIRWAEDEIETETNIRLCQTWIASPPTKTKYVTDTVGLIPKYQYQQLGVDYDYADAAYDFFLRGRKKKAGCISGCDGARSSQWRSSTPPACSMRPTSRASRTSRSSTRCCPSTSACRSVGSWKIRTAG